jgi:hypothetical protein
MRAGDAWKQRLKKAPLETLLTNSKQRLKKAPLETLQTASKESSTGNTPNKPASRPHIALHVFDKETKITAHAKSTESNTGNTASFHREHIPQRTHSTENTFHREHIPQRTHSTRK